MNKMINRCLLQLFVAGLMASFASVAPAAVYINEIYIDPPGALDSTHEYVELRGTPGMSLVNHYLIFVENTDPTGSSGSIEHVFNLNTRSLGSNGYLTLLQQGFPNPYSVASGTTNLINTGSGAGFGSGFSSLIGASDSNSNGEIENMGFTAMLMRNDSGIAPYIGLDLDTGNNGMDVPNGNAGWTILDSIGFLQQSEALGSRSYGKVNYGPAAFPTSQIEPGTTFVAIGYEVELLARWGNSTGQSDADWHVTNLTNNAGSGYQAGSSNFRQSGNPHQADDGNINTPPQQPPTIESNKGVPYGTILTNTLGAPNFLLGDYNKDGVVDAADYVVWRNTQGQTGSDLADHPADGDHNYVVGSADYAVWRAHFGQPLNGGSPAAGTSLGTIASSVPEPAGWLLAALASLGAMQLRKRQAA